MWCGWKTVWFSSLSLDSPFATPNSVACVHKNNCAFDHSLKSIWLTQTNCGKLFLFLFLSHSVGLLSIYWRINTMSCLKMIVSRGQYMDWNWWEKGTDKCDLQKYTHAQFHLFARVFYVLLRFNLSMLNSFEWQCSTSLHPFDSCRFHINTIIYQWPSTASIRYWVFYI